MSKIALVTGANKGIGLETARQLARDHDFHVFLGVRDRERGEEAVQTLKNEGLSVEFQMLDVSDATSIGAAARALENQVGLLDVLVNNAAINLGQDGILEADAEIFRRTFETNVWGPLQVTQAFWPLLLKSDSARVVNVSSGLGRLFDMKNESPAYSVSKTALNGLTRQFAGLGEGKISVNSICPGWVRTDMGGPNSARLPAQGAAIIIKLATMDAPPSGKYLNDAGEIGW